jgi:hypothetical protein
LSPAVTYYETFPTKGSHVSTILSLGSGRLGTLAAPLNAKKGWMDALWYTIKTLATQLVDVKDEWMSILQEMVNGCEKVAQDMEMQVGHLGIYYRFTVEQGLQRIHGVDANDIG